jgi:RNA polymerase sigma-70 factor (ECF subfamily)
MTHGAQLARTAELSPREEASLVCRVEAGDQLACTRLVTVFGPQMMNIARRFLPSDDDCDDAIQDAFISVFNAIGRFNSDSRLGTWLYRITVNACLMKLRSDSSRREISLEELLPMRDSRAEGPREAAEMDDPSCRVETDEIRSLVHRAIDKLAPADRAVLLLRDIQQLDTSATAALLETSVHNVKRRLRRAREMLCSHLEPHIRPIPTSNTRVTSVCI